MKRSRANGGQAASAAADPLKLRPASRRDTKRMKVLLVGALFVGALAYSGANGSFSSFNAEINNPGSSLASGTLTLNETTGGVTTCYSWQGVNSTDNTNSNCGALFSLSNVEPGQWSLSTNTTTVAIENSGSLPASQFSFFAPAAASCSDTATTSPPVAGATYGSELNFVTAANNKLCQETDMFIEENSGSNYYCWFGAEDQTSGLCAQPMTASLSASVTSCTSATSITLSSQPGTIAAGDSLYLTGPAANCTFTATGGPYPPKTGSSTISVTSGAYSSGSGSIASGTVVNNTVASELSYSSDTGTVANFDSSYNKSQRLTQLYPITGPGTVASSGSEFSAVTTRNFTVGIYISNPTSSDENNLQGLSLGFEIDWYINQ